MVIAYASLGVGGAGALGTLLHVAIRGCKNRKASKSEEAPNPSRQPDEPLPQTNETSQIEAKTEKPPKAESTLFEEFFTKLECLTKIELQQKERGLTEEAAQALNQAKNEQKEKLHCLSKIFFDNFSAKFGVEKPDTIKLDDLAEALGASPQQLERLFDDFRFPEVSRSNGACLNVFFALLCDFCKPGVAVRFSPSLQQILGSNLPYWPEGKAPGRNSLSVKEFSDWLGITPGKCIKTFNCKKIPQVENLAPETILTGVQMILFCEQYSQGTEDRFLEPRDLSCKLDNCCTTTARFWYSENQWAYKPSD